MVLLLLLLFQDSSSGGQEVISPPKLSGGEACDSAVVAFRAGKIEHAAEMARLCIQKGGASSETYKLLALASFLLQRVDDFRTNIEKAIELNPADGGAHYHLGRFLYERQQFKDAISRFRIATDLDPENYRASYFSGLSRQAGGDGKGSIQDYRKAIEIIERKRVAYGWPFADLGDLLVLQGDFDSGLSWIYRGTRNDPTLPYTHYVYARTLLRKEASFEVEKALERAIQLDPGYVEAYYLLGRYYSRTGDQQRAKSAFAKFDELRKNPAPSPFGLRR